MAIVRLWVLGIGVCALGSVLGFPSYAERCLDLHTLWQVSSDLPLTHQETNIRNHIIALLQQGVPIARTSGTQSSPGIKLPPAGRFKAKTIPLHRLRHLKPHIESLLSPEAPEHRFQTRFGISLSELEARMETIFRLSIAHRDPDIGPIGEIHEQVAAWVVALHTLSAGQPPRALTFSDTRLRPQDEDSFALMLNTDLFEREMAQELSQQLDQGPFAFDTQDLWFRWLMLDRRVFKKSSFELFTFYVLNFGAYLTEMDKVFLAQWIPTAIKNSQKLSRWVDPEDVGSRKHRAAFLKEYPRQQSKHYGIWFEILSRAQALPLIEKTYGVTIPPQIEQANLPSLMRVAQWPQEYRPEDGKFLDLSSGKQVNGLTNIFAPYIGKRIRELPPLSAKALNLTHARLISAIFGSDDIEQLSQMVLYHRTTDLGAAEAIYQGESVVSLGKQSVFGGSAVWGEGVYGSLRSDLYRYGPFVITFRLNPEAIIGKDIDFFNGSQDGYIVVVKNNNAFLPDQTRFDLRQRPERQESGINHIRWISQVETHLTVEEKRDYLQYVLTIAKTTININPYDLFVIVETLRSILTSELEAQVQDAFSHQQRHQAVFPSAQDLEPHIDQFDFIANAQGISTEALGQRFFSNDAIVAFLHHSPYLLTTVFNDRFSISQARDAGLKIIDDLGIVLRAAQSRYEREQEHQHLNIPDTVRLSGQRAMQANIDRVQTLLKLARGLDIEAIHPARLLALYEDIFQNRPKAGVLPATEVAAIQNLLLRIGTVLLPIQKTLEATSQLPETFLQLPVEYQKTLIQKLQTYNFETTSLKSPSK